MKIAIVGGAFDPPHNGHLALAQHTLDANLGIDKVWLMPCFNSLHNKTMRPAKDRLEMVKILARDEPDISASDWEIRNELTGSSYELITLLKENYPQHQFVFVIGQDNANSIDAWVKAEELKKGHLIPFLVFVRKGCPPNEKQWYLQPPHYYVTITTIPEISSTVIRESLRDGRQPQHLDMEVFKYAYQHRLYGGKVNVC